MSKERDFWVFESVTRGEIDPSLVPTILVFVDMVVRGATLYEVAVNAEHRIAEAEWFADWSDPALSFIRSHMDELKLVIE